MFFGSDFFWMLMGAGFVLVYFALKTFLEERGIKLNWWKSLLALIWYGFFLTNFYLYGTLTGEFEQSAGLKIMLLGLFIALILAVGLWRVLLIKPRETA